MGAFSGDRPGIADGPNPIPTVSIGLPVFNGERYLEAMVQSILRQTYTDFELIICDNASTDGTGAICQRMAAADPRIRYYRNEANIGGRLNHLRVLDLSRGPIFKWAGHDDFLQDRFLERCLQALENAPNCVLAFSNIEVIDADGAVLEKIKAPAAFGDPLAHRRLRSFWQGSLYNQLAVFHGLIRREALKRTALLADWYGADRWLVVELALLGPFALVEEMLMQYRDHSRRSAYQADPQAYWAPNTRMYLGVIRRIRRAAFLLKTGDLSTADRRAVFKEYVRYAVSSSPYWSWLLVHELIAAGRRGIRRT